ncbi:MAG: class I SAM-dependent methyltransferase [Dehalococcoidia bacterium]|nr:class I SAM-dependent methyltransferase [Dehalococcoidia bacterium]MDD5493724.1 class I SAM-dependent methyltransferase [Dehalococcoidia bacterium]
MKNTEQQMSRDNVEEELKYYDKLYSDESYSDKQIGGKKKNWFNRLLADMAPTIPNVWECSDRLVSELGDIGGKKVCDLGCGTGVLTEKLVKRGADVHAIDISSEAVKKTKERLEKLPSSKVLVSRMNACATSFDNDTFDIVTGTYILHHMDITKSGKEISRILKPGGRAVFTEPLAHNPISNLWRKLSPQIRTQNEWPLRYKEVREIGKNFSLTKYDEFDFLPLFSAIVYLVTFNQNAKARSAEYLARIEPSFFKVFAPLKRFSGEILIEFIK